MPTSQGGKWEQLPLNYPLLLLPPHAWERHSEELLKAPTPMLLKQLPLRMKIRFHPALGWLEGQDKEANPSLGHTLWLLPFPSLQAGDPPPSFKRTLCSCKLEPVPPASRAPEEPSSCSRLCRMAGRKPDTGIIKPRPPSISSGQPGRR